MVRTRPGHRSHVSNALTNVQRNSTQEEEAKEQSEKAVTQPIVSYDAPDPHAATFALGDNHTMAGRLVNSVLGMNSRQEGPIVFVKNLTHPEVGALVGPELCWKNPFEVSHTPRALTVCIDVLDICNRHRLVSDILRSKCGWFKRENRVRW